MPATIGQMNKQVVIQQKTTANDAEGQPQETWRGLCAVNAAVEPLSAREVFQARQAEVIASHRVTIWYRNEVESVAPLLRIVYTRDGADRILNIVTGTAVSD
jgi:SPP1 family predicted phage head-tail adaptor